MAEKKTAKEEGPFTYRTRPTADGRYFTFAKYNLDGEEVEVSPMFWPSEADAEKAARSVVSHDDVLAVTRVRSVDAEDNSHVVLEKSAEDARDENFGMAVQYKSDRSDEEGDNDFRPVDPNYTPAMKAVDEGTVAPVVGDTTPTDAEQKAIDKAQEKADKEESEDKA